MWGDKVELDRNWHHDWTESVVTYSNREYIRYEIPGLRIDGPAHSPERKPVTVHLYLDCETGVMVGNVALYEEGLGLEPEVRMEY